MTRDYLLKNGARFVAIGSPGKVEFDGWRDGDWFYILPETWATIHGGNELVEAARYHRDAGLLKIPKGNSLQYRMPRAVVERPKVYAIRASILESA